MCIMISKVNILLHNFINTIDLDILNIDQNLSSQILTIFQKDLYNTFSIN